ncbi:MAG: putative Ig domain-containing protein [Terracidiphilus sp.]
MKIRHVLARPFFVQAVYLCLVLCALVESGSRATALQILTPPSSSKPRVNGPTIFGIRPGSPFIYSIPATGDRPMTFSVDNLPAGLEVNSSTGLITGKMAAAGEYPVVLRARNALGEAHKNFRIEVGEKIGLTPALGWSSWNAIAHDITQERILRNAQALVSSGLKDHGFTYINLDDCWQGARGGPYNAIQGNELFPDLQLLVDQVHALGLKFGVYSTPWIASYGGFPGGSSDNPDGKFVPGDHTLRRWLGKYSFASNDAKQWAAWGVDYVKEDWNPSDIEHTKEIYEALRASGRDMILSLSNTAEIEHAAEYGRYAQSWRVTPDILDIWDQSDNSAHTSMSEDGFALGVWAPFRGPGGFADADMLVVGRISFGKWIRQTRLTPDEQYTHISLWAMLSSPLIIGADLERLDPFTLSLLTNDEVLDIDQDALGRPATLRETIGGIDVYVKDLEDGSHAVGFFNRSDASEHYAFNKLDRIGLSGVQHVRDLWRQKDLPDVNGAIAIDVPAHGVLLYRFSGGTQTRESHP